MSSIKSKLARSRSNYYCTTDNANFADLFDSIRRLIRVYIECKRYPEGLAVTRLYIISRLARQNYWINVDAQYSYRTYIKMSVSFFFDDFLDILLFLIYTMSTYTCYTRS